MKKILTKLQLSSRGFTLIELMVVMTVIAILATMALYGLGKGQAAARDASRQQIMNGVQVALERFYGDQQAYPGGNFCQMIATLTVPANQYLASGPLDPCRNGGVPTAVCGNGTVACGTINVVYQYSPGAGNQTYTLTLQKEAGGTPTTFRNPQ